MTTDTTTTATDVTALLRRAASAGTLAADRPDDQTCQLRKAAYDLVWPLVFNRHTRGLEQRKGHWRCASSVERLSAECVDGFHDDVEAVLHRLMRHEAPIHNIKGWVAVNISGATIDGHRRRRGATGALQRARVPGWLSAALGADPWLVELAKKIIEWAGLPVTAGQEIWPREAWAQHRAEYTDDRAISSPARIDTELRHVLQVMQSSDADWFAARVEEPIGCKQAPLTHAASDDQIPLLPGDGTEAGDADLAALALIAIEAGLEAGGDPAAVVREVVAALFLGASSIAGELAELPRAASVRDARLTAVLADDQELSALVDVVLAGLEVDRSGNGSRGVNDGRTGARAATAPPVEGSHARRSGR